MSVKTKDTAVSGIRKELADCEARAAMLRSALQALTGEQPAKTVTVLQFPPRQRMRNARKGERQARVLDAYGKLTQEVSHRHFLRSLSQAPRQQGLYRNTMERQITLGRITRRRGVLIPRRQLAVA